MRLFGIGLVLLIALAVAGGAVLWRNLDARAEAVVAETFAALPDWMACRYEGLSVTPLVNKIRAERLECGLGTSAAMRRRFQLKGDALQMQYPAGLGLDTGQLDRLEILAPELIAPNMARGAVRAGRLSLAAPDLAALSGWRPGDAAPFEALISGRVVVENPDTAQALEMAALEIAPAADGTARTSARDIVLRAGRGDMGLTLDRISMEGVPLTGLARLAARGEAPDTLPPELAGRVRRMEMRDFEVTGAPQGIEIKLARFDYRLLDERPEMRGQHVEIEGLTVGLPPHLRLVAGTVPGLGALLGGDGRIEIDMEMRNRLHLTRGVGLVEPAWIEMPGMLRLDLKARYSTDFRSGPQSRGFPPLAGHDNRLTAAHLTLSGAPFFEFLAQSRALGGATGIAESAARLISANNARIRRARDEIRQAIDSKSRLVLRARPEGRGVPLAWFAQAEDPAAWRALAGHLNIQARATPAEAE